MRSSWSACMEMSMCGGEIESEDRAARDEGDGEREGGSEQAMRRGRDGGCVEDRVG